MEIWSMVVGDMISWAIGAIGWSVVALILSGAIYLSKKAFNK